MSGAITITGRFRSDDGQNPDQPIRYGLTPKGRAAAIERATKSADQRRGASAGKSGKKK
jgi:hypothetical protein